MFEILAVLVYSLEHISPFYKVKILRFFKDFHKLDTGEGVPLRDAVHAGPDPHDPHRLSLHHHRPGRGEVPHCARSLHQDQGQSPFLKVFCVILSVCTLC